jgi:hypothetical protein
MDPLCILELTVAITDIVQGLYDYATAVKDAKDEIRRLTQELFALRGALEHFDLQRKSNAPSSASIGRISDGQIEDVMSLTQQTLESIESTLKKPKSKFGKVAQCLVWPFKVGDVEKYLASIERAKTWFIMVILNDSAHTIDKTYEEVKELMCVLHEDVIERKADAMIRETDELLSWLAPFDSVEELEEARKGRSPGTGQWIWDKHMIVWEECMSPASGQPFIWIHGRCK